VSSGVDRGAAADPRSTLTAPQSTVETLGAMPIDALTPYARVVDMGLSIDFYRLLGLEVANAHEEEGKLVRAFLTNPAADPNHASARLM
jgi:hypothetical protein